MSSHPDAARALPLAHKRAHGRLLAGREHLRKHRWVEAERELGAAVGVATASAHDWLGLAIARVKLQQFESALDAADRAAAVAPGLPEVHDVRAQCCMHLGRQAQAIAVYEAMPGGGPTHHDSLLNYGTALVHCNRAAEAIAPYMQALAQKMDSVLAYVRLGAAFKQLKLYEQAVECFRTAVALEPDNLTAHGYLVHLDQFACRWDHFDADVQALLAALGQVHASGSLAHECTPFALLAIPHHPLQLRQAAELEARRLSHGVKPLPPVKRVRAPGERLRIAYLSCDFYQHATALLATEVLERHDRSRFELFLYDHSKDDRSAVRQRLQRAACHWVELGAATPRQIAERMRADGIDILIDLKGYTQGHRLQTLALRPAPLQMSWLGFPGTTGAAFVDYFIGDRWVTPLEHAPHYREKLAQMPRSYQPNDRGRAPGGGATRADWGLPEAAVVLACFNNVFKITPEVWESWMRLLHAAPDTVLWLLDANDQAKSNLRDEAAKRGIDPARIHFALAVPPEHHQARLALADLMLDTWPCNAHTTASDALWAGLPIVTLSGETFASRVAGSLLHAVDLPELVCETLDDYEATVLRLVRDPAARAALRARLADAREHAPLFDSERFARDLEALYLRAWARHAAGLPPDHLPAEHA
ncbi:tetratricopeptide repeat protein [uncultured Methylibium sp.]|uniref:O-linked N-acetylglucosamine transferase, SPINDLY family protein n=1 Tax=uncultured Methylibium sp. TaxID=381093 RepID=UPI0025D63D55|nr:tetratricopeptide repeat protein [uncultured Methylibium sp.]